MGTTATVWASLVRSRWEGETTHMRERERAHVKEMAYPREPLGSISDTAQIDLKSVLKASSSWSKSACGSLEV